MVAGDGIEPPFQDSEPCVLPLHQPAIWKSEEDTEEFINEEAEERDGEENEDAL